MHIDSTILYVFQKELVNRILHAQVRQIHQIDNRIIDMELFCPNAKPVHLIFDTYKPIVYIPQDTDRNNTYAPSQTFCMTLRKNLEGSRLSSIEQVNFDRILQFSFDRIESAGEIITKKLYAELIPSAPNLILTEDEKIIDACIRGRKINRFLVPGAEYQLNSNVSRMNFLLFSHDELLKIINFNRTKDISVQGWLFQTFNGFSTPILDELYVRTKISVSKPLNSLTDQELQSLSSGIYSIAYEILTSDSLYVYEKNKRSSYATPLSLIDKKPIRKISASSWLESEMERAGGTISTELQQLRQKIHALVKRENKKLIKIREEMEETAKMDQYRLWGNLLSIYSCESIKGKESIIVDNLFTDPPTKETIPVNPLISITDNSQAYFKKYAKLKTRTMVGQGKLTECRSKLDYLENLSYFLDEIKDKNELIQLKDELRNAGIDKNKVTKAKHQKKEPAPAFLTILLDGFKIYIGKNNTQNEYLTLHKAKKNDLWFHAKEIPGSHVILETANQSIPEDLLLKIASMAAFHSKGKDSGKVAVDYTFIKNVKKISNGPPGLVNYSHQKTLVVKPMEYR